MARGSAVPSASPVMASRCTFMMSVINWYPDSDARHSQTGTFMASSAPELHPRERMIQSALVLMGEHGVEGTSFSQVIEHSGAPRGSIYHHFPGGKAQLVEEATRYGGDVVVKLLTEAIEQHDPVAAVDSIGGFWRAVLYDSD